MTPVTSGIIASIVGTGGVASVTVPYLVINRNRIATLDSQKTNLEEELGKYKNSNQQLTSKNTDLEDKNSRLTTENVELKKKVNDSHNYLVDAFKAWISKTPNPDYNPKKTADIPDNAQCALADGDYYNDKNRTVYICYNEK